MIDGDRIVPPGQFLPGLGIEALEQLFFVSLSAGAAELAACAASHPNLTISFNVSPRVMLQDSLLRSLLHVLASEAIDPQQIMLEMLEDDQFFNLQTARSHPHRLERKWVAYRAG